MRNEWIELIIVACAVFVGNRLEAPVKRRVRNSLAAWLIIFGLTCLLVLGPFAIIRNVFHLI